MAAFAASFLANPFEAEATQTIDQYGNIFNANGQHIGVKPGSQADVGSAGVPYSASTSAAPTAAAPTSPMPGMYPAAAAAPATSGSSTSSAIWSKLSGLLRKITGVDAVENITFIVVGLILIAAGVFSFKPVRDTVVEVGKAAVAA